MKKEYVTIFGFWLVFELIAVVLWQTQHNLFYLFNFSYIGTCLAAGLLLYQHKWKYARNAVQFAVGLYMLVYLGILSRENMQLEGFWYYLFSGVFEAAVIHYLVAKILGPLLFGRGWCGYACWTAMILDLLPYKTAQTERKTFGWVRYIVFVASFTFVASLFVFQVAKLETIMFWSFLIGNVLYYTVGVALALYCKDNRAFCKYICPVTVFLKPASYFAALRIKCDTSLCVRCGMCKKVCPMDVDMTDNARNRKNGTECILCMNCIEHCPKKALYL